MIYFIQANYGYFPQKEASLIIIVDSKDTHPIKLFVCCQKMADDFFVSITYVDIT